MRSFRTLMIAWTCILFLSLIYLSSATIHASSGVSADLQQVCKLFDTCGDKNPLPQKPPCWLTGECDARPSLDDLEREAGNAWNHLKKEGGNLGEWSSEAMKDLLAYGVAKEGFAELGRGMYISGAAIMARRSPTGQPMSADFREALRPIYGPLVDQVTLHWGTPLLDKWSSDQVSTWTGGVISVNVSGTESEGQVYGYDIYIERQAPIGSSANERIRTLNLLIHEMVHVQQFVNYGGSLSNYGYHYFKAYAEARLSYENNRLERDAETKANDVTVRCNAHTRLALYDIAGGLNVGWSGRTVQGWVSFCLDNSIGAVRSEIEHSYRQHRSAQEQQEESEEAARRAQIVQMAQNGQIEALLPIYFTGKTKESNYGDNAVWMDAETILAVCWYGTLHGYVEQVWWLCEEAVNVYGDNNARSKRALIRAIRGEWQQAIEDLQYYIDTHPADAKGIAQRQAWIAELTAGRNPFTGDLSTYLPGSGTSDVISIPDNAGEEGASTLEQTLLRNLEGAALRPDYPAESRAFALSLLAHRNQFQSAQSGISQQALRDAILRPDVGLRINATVNRVWADWLPYGPRTVQSDPASQNLTPFRVLVIRLIQGRQLSLTSSEQHALYNLLTRSESTENWSGEMNGIIGAINRESFQNAFQTGNSVVTNAQITQPAQGEPVAQPQQDPPNPIAPSVEPASSGAGRIMLITDFEQFGAWKRGDEAWGVFEQSGEQAVSGRSAGKFTYDFPAAENNYIVYRNTLPITGQPNALGIQVYGDGSTHFLNAWVQDANGQLWQFTFGRIKHRGWQQMVAPLDLNVGWPNQAVGNATTSAPAYPLRFYAFVLDGYASDQSFNGVIFVDDLVALE